VNRVPPSNRPPPPIIRPPRRPRHVEHKHEVKQEEQLEEGEISEVSGAQHHILKAHEENAHEHAEAMGWTTDSHAEAHERKADKEEQLAESQRQEEDGQGQKKVKQPLKTTTEAKKADQNKPGLHQTVKKDEFQKPPPQQSGLQAKHKPAIDALGTARMGATEAVSAAGTTDAVREAAERAAKSGRPPDAMQLLNQAQEHGVFFKEDSERGGAEEQEDPELAAAVEETIKLLFGVRGVLRIGPGRNQADEPVIVIVAAQGFGEASMRVVPEKVHRFPTLVALPYDVLPLKRER
jgi:hypothetical protein